MKPNVILLVDADADTCAATLAAARRARLDVRYAQVTRDLSEITEYRLDDIALIVLDFDPDVHGAAISEAFQEWSPPRPVILLSSTEGTQPPTMLLGKTAKHLSKPVSIERLTKTIEEFARAPQNRFDCDRWGHPIEDCNISCGNPEEELVAQQH